MGYAEQQFLLEECLDQPGMMVWMDGYQYRIEFATRPTAPSGGEPKTSCFLLMSEVNSGEQRVVKISRKGLDSHFVESKISAQRAEEIFGEQWNEMIWNAAVRLGENFWQRPLIYLSGSKAGSFTLGWRCDVVSVPSGDLVTDAFFFRSQKLEMYSGASLPESKRNCYVGDAIVADSGVANYYLEADLAACVPGDQASAQWILDQCIPIDDVNISFLPDLYFAFKALNYRSFEGAYDGNRPLAVMVEWYANANGQLDANLIFFDQQGGTPPLYAGGDEAYGYLMDAMQQLGIKDVTGLNQANLSPNVNIKA